MLNAADLLVLDLCEQIAELRSSDEAHASPTGEPIPATTGIPSLESAAMIAHLTRQVAELERRLATAQDDLVEMTREADLAHGRIKHLLSEVIVLAADRDAWRAQAKRSWWRRLTG
jgi:hypothetical protein